MVGVTYGGTENYSGVLVNAAEYLGHPGACTACLNNGKNIKAFIYLAYVNDLLYTHQLQ